MTTFIHWTNSLSWHGSVPSNFHKNSATDFMRSCYAEFQNSGQQFYQTLLSVICMMYYGNTANRIFYITMAKQWIIWFWAWQSIHFCYSDNNASIVNTSSGSRVGNMHSSVASDILGERELLRWKQRQHQENDRQTLSHAVQFPINKHNNIQRQC